MTSPLPPRVRDTRDRSDLIRHLRQNTKQLGVGFAGGRFPPAKPLGRPFSDGEEDDALDEQISFLNSDRAVAHSAGSITLLLTYEPLDGSLHIRWNGLDQPPTDWRLNGRVVTFTNPHLHVGDVLSAAYAYLEPDEVASTALGSLELRGVTSHTGALPPETQVGDFVVIATLNTFSTFNDPRFPVLSTTGTEGRVYAGIATDLGALTPSVPGGYVVVASFVGGAAVDAVNFDVDPAHPSVAAQPGTAAIGVATERSSLVAGSTHLDTAFWTFAVDDIEAPGWGQVALYYWSDPSSTTTPSATASPIGGVDETEAYLITLIGTGE